MVFEDLADVVERLDVPPTCEAIAELLPLLSRLEAKVSVAVDEVNHAGEWELEGATSMASWLRWAGTMSGGAAKAMVTVAERVAQLPMTAAAWDAGDLSSGHVRVIAAQVEGRRLELFAEHEAALVPTLVPLTVAQTVNVMAHWRAHADALIDGPEPDDDVRSLKVSRTAEDRRILTGSFDAIGGEVIEAALRLATTADSDTERRSATQRRADALVDICRHFLDNQQTKAGGRHRPHLNVVVDLDKVDGGGTFISGSVAPSAFIESVLCDCSLHRVLAKGRSSILDYGRSARTAPPDLFNAIALRDGHCREPGCDRPPSWCDAHHVDVWDEGGVTSLANSVLRCTRHHHQWHKRRKLGWTERLEDDGTLVITDLSGRTYSSYADGPLAQRQLWAS